MPYTTTLLPAVREELNRRAVATFGTRRASNRVIEEAMGFAVVQQSETEDVDITVDDGVFYGDVCVTVELFPGSGEARVDCARHNGTPKILSEEDEARAIAAAWRKREES